MPQSGQANGIISTGIVAIDVEDFHGIADFEVVSPMVVAIPHFLKPEG